MRLVLDASMALAWLFERDNPEDTDRAERALSSLIGAKTLVPPLWHIEIANALLVGERRRVVTEAQVIDYLNRLYGLPIDTDDAAPASRRDMVMAMGREYGLRIW